MTNILMELCNYQNYIEAGLFKLQSINVVIVETITVGKHNNQHLRNNSNTVIIETNNVNYLIL